MELQLRKKVMLVALATTCILMVPLVAMQFSDEVVWGIGDFIAMGTLLFGAGLAYVLIARASENIAYRIAVAIAVVAGLILIWMNLAVGIIGSEDNPANLMFVGVLQIGVIGVAIARLKPRGMARALYATAIAQASVPLIAVVFCRPALEEPPGFVGVFILNGFFVSMFVISGSLFRHASDNDPQWKEQPE